jgi:uncharacterized Ntn-hydrolase superfamily protein
VSSLTTEPMISTYSIVACDLRAREWGVAVQSKFLAVGAAVPFAKAELGAVATQALANLAYGPAGLALLEQGLTAEQVVARLTDGDERREHRQLGVVDAQGGSATYTGQACLDWAGGVAGPCFAAQGNILVSAETVAALAATFETSTGQALALRLLACLRAAQEAGGDRRGQQSASLLVVRHEGGYGGMSDRLVDLRVDDHPAPIVELSRLFEIHETLFGETPRQQWLTVSDELRDEIATRLRALGYNQEALEDAFGAWVGTENLEERADGLDHVDPVVLAALRAARP